MSANERAIAAAQAVDPDPIMRHVTPVRDPISEALARTSERQDVTARAERAALAPANGAVDAVAAAIRRAE